jgi:hypothetical protein
MLDYLTLENKPLYTINGETATDLLYKTWNTDKNFSGDYLLVNEYYIARPDLISLAVYGEDRYADIICKVNGISNPFELNEGQIIFIPTIESIENILDLDAKTLTTKKINDEETINTIERIGAQRKKTEKRSPAQQVEGDSNYIIDKSLGVVFY